MHRHSCTHATKNQLLTVESFVKEKNCHFSSPLNYLHIFHTPLLPDSRCCFFFFPLISWLLRHQQHSLACFSVEKHPRLRWSTWSFAELCWSSGLHTLLYHFGVSLPISRRKPRAFLGSVALGIRKSVTLFQCYSFIPSPRYGLLSVFYVNI